MPTSSIDVRRVRPRHVRPGSFRAINVAAARMHRPSTINASSAPARIARTRCTLIRSARAGRRARVSRMRTAPRPAARTSSARASVVAQRSTVSSRTVCRATVGRPRTSHHRPSRIGVASRPRGRSSVARAADLSRVHRPRAALGGSAAAARRTSVRHRGRRSRRATAAVDVAAARSRPITQPIRRCKLSSHPRGADSVELDPALPGDRASVQ